MAEEITLWSKEDDTLSLQVQAPPRNPTCAAQRLKRGRPRASAVTPIKTTQSKTKDKHDCDLFSSETGTLPAREQALLTLLALGRYALQS